MSDKKKELIERIVKQEWDFFQQVNNEGGRADCQDNWETFLIMRTAQYDPWPMKLLLQMNLDLMNAEDYDVAIPQP